MPRQKVFLTRQIGERRVQVIKTYDQSFARETFDDMDEAAQDHLWRSLGVEESYGAEAIPSAAGPDRGDFLWEEVTEAAREDGNVFSFFVVTGAESAYISPDWPSAEAFALGR